MGTEAFVTFTKIAFRNVRRHWRQSLAAMLSIATGFVALSMTEGYLSDLSRFYFDMYAGRGMLGTVVVEHEGAAEHAREDQWNFGLNHADQVFLADYLAAHAPEVDSAVRHLYVTGMIGNGRSQAVFLGYGYDVQEGARMRKGWAWNTIAGVPLQLAQGNAIVVGRRLGETLGCETAVKLEHMNPAGGYKADVRPFHCARPKMQLSATTSHAQLNAVDAVVSGIVDGGYKEYDRRWVAMPLEMAQRLFDTDTVTRLAIALKDPNHGGAFATDLLREAASKGLRFEAQPWQQHPFYGEMYRRSMDLLGMVGWFIKAVVVTIASLSVLNTVLKLVSERTREIGTLRSLGFRRPHIVLLFTLEAATLALLACVMGLVVTLFLTEVVNLLRFHYTAGLAAEPVTLRIERLPGVYAASALFLSVIAVCAALLPAKRASEKSIPDALGHL